MRQRTAEKPEAVRIEQSDRAGFVEIVITTNVQPLQVVREDGKEATEYESDVSRLTYPAANNLQEYAEANLEVFAELAVAEEKAGEPTQNADKLAALTIENAEMKAAQDDMLIIVTDMIGGVE